MLDDQQGWQLQQHHGTWVHSGGAAARSNATLQLFPISIIFELSAPCLCPVQGLQHTRNPFSIGQRPEWSPGAMLLPGNAAAIRPDSRGLSCVRTHAAGQRLPPLVGHETTLARAASLCTLAGPQTHQATLMQGFCLRCTSFHAHKQPQSTNTRKGGVT